MSLSPTTNAYLRDLLDQPRALRETLAGLATERLPERFLARAYERVVLTGMGSSYFAFHPLHQALTRRGVEAHLVETAELLDRLSMLLRPGTLVIAASQSGRSAETVGLLAGKAAGFTLLGMSNTPGSPLAQGADNCILTRAGEEATVSCKTYLAALAALAWLEQALLGEPAEDVLVELEDAVSGFAAYLGSWEAHVADLRERMASTRDLFLVGRGPSLASAGTGGLIVKESAHLHAEGMSSAAFRHGPLEMVGRETFVVVFAGLGGAVALNRRLYKDVRAAGCPVGWVAAPVELAPADFVGEEGDDDSPPVFRLPSGGAVTLPLVEILPVQMMTLALADLKGHEPGTFTHGSKVTTVA